MQNLQRGKLVPTMLVPASILVLWIVCSCCLGATVRILEGVDRKSDKDDNTLEYVEPDPMYGPSDLFFLKGSCFTNSFERYEYTVCPFHNVTQKRTTALKAQVIGLWGNWKTTTSTVHAQKGPPKKVNSHHAAHSSDTATVEVAPIESPGDSSHSYYNVMEYPNGKNCGHGPGRTTVYLECEHSQFEIKSIDSELNCEYALTLGLPLSCSLLRVDK
jgi:hypothetical protein